MVRYELENAEKEKALKMRLRPDYGRIYIEVHDGDDWVKIGFYGVLGIFESVYIIDRSAVKLERLGLSIINGIVKIQ